MPTTTHGYSMVKFPYLNAFSELLSEVTSSVYAGTDIPLDGHRIFVLLNTVCHAQFIPPWKQSVEFEHLKKNTEG